MKACPPWWPPAWANKSGHWRHYEQRHWSLFRHRYRPVFLFERTELAVDGSPAQDRAAERTRFEDALSAVIAQTEQLYENALRNMGQEEANIFEAHRMLLEDPEMIDPHPPGH